MEGSFIVTVYTENMQKQVGYELIIMIVINFGSTRIIWIIISTWFVYAE